MKEVSMKGSLLWAQVLFLVSIQVTSLIVLWVLNPLSQTSTDTFALYLSLDLISFVILSYIYRSNRNAVPYSQEWVSVGYLTIIVLLVSNLALAR